MQRLSLDVVRRSNLSMILSLVHAERELSRAAITRATGLSRSTVGALLADLTAVDLVREEEPKGTSQVGRPSATVAVSPSVVTAAVEIAPERIEVALGSLGGVLLARRSAPVDHDRSPQTIARLSGELLVSARDGLAQPARLFAVTAAVVGRVDPDDRTVLTSSELGWDRVPFADLLSATVQRPATVCYRTQLVAGAERVWGRARDVDSLVYLHGAAAGVGGVAIADGERLRGGAGLAARLGHLYVGDLDPGRPGCICGNRGCLMAMVTEKDLLDAMGRGRPPLDAADLDDMTEALTAVVQGASTEHTDAAARLVEADLAYLVTALQSVMVAYDPDAIMLGGFLTLLLRIGRQRLREGLDSVASAELRTPPLLIEPSLGPDQVLLGATDRAFADLLADPLGTGVASLTYG